MPDEVPTPDLAHAGKAEVMSAAPARTMSGSSRDFAAAILQAG